MVCAYFFKFDNELSKNRKLQKYRIILSQNANNLPTQTIPTYSVRMREKIDQNNSEYEHFRRSVAGFNFFYWRMNKSNLHNDIGISSFRNGLNHPFGPTGFYFKSKIIDGSYEVKK